MTTNPEPVEPEVTGPNPEQAPVENDPVQETPDVSQPEPVEEEDGPFETRDTPPGVDPETTEGETTSTEGETTAPPAPESVYDPGQHSVAEVQRYVEENPGEAAAIRSAEQDGKKRVTLIEWLDARITKEN
jgi:hypothetical protein